MSAASARQIHLDGERVVDAWVAATQPVIFSAGETTDLGADSATPVSDDCSGALTGRVRWVQIDLGKDAEDAAHLNSPEGRLRVVMARQ